MENKENILFSKSQKASRCRFHCCPSSECRGYSENPSEAFLNGKNWDVQSCRVVAKFLQGLLRKAQKHFLMDPNWDVQSCRGVAKFFVGTFLKITQKHVFMDPNWDVQSCRGVAKFFVGTFLKIARLRGGEHDTKKESHFQKIAFVLGST